MNRHFIFAKKYKKLLLSLLFLLVSGIAFPQKYYKYRSNYPPYTYDQMYSNAMAKTQLHKQLESDTRNAKNYVVDIYKKNIDDKLRAELKADYEFLEYLANYLNKNGVSWDLIDIFNKTCEEINRHIESYNNRIMGF